MRAPGHPGLWHLPPSVRHDAPAARHPPTPPSGLSCHGSHSGETGHVKSQGEGWPSAPPNTVSCSRKKPCCRRGPDRFGQVWNETTCFFCQQRAGFLLRVWNLHPCPERPTGPPRPGSYCPAPIRELLLAAHLPALQIFLMGLFFFFFFLPNCLFVFVVCCPSQHTLHSWSLPDLLCSRAALASDQQKQLSISQCSIIMKPWARESEVVE